MRNSAKFKELLGKILKEVTASHNEIIFKCTDGAEYRMFHNQDCCESVEIKDICGELNDLIGEEILVANEVSSEADDVKGLESMTWTFYILRTNKTTVTISWIGESNGYYSESVDFERTNGVSA